MASVNRRGSTGPISATASPNAASDKPSTVVASDTGMSILRASCLTTVEEAMLAPNHPTRACGNPLDSKFAISANEHGLVK